MAHIKEPNGVDFFVDPTPLTKQERQQISDLIAYYKRTGRKKLMQKTISRKKVSHVKKSLVKSSNTTI
jgi:hypothetical protein